MLKASFGYSPHLDTKSQNPKVTNNLRFDLDDFVTDESRNYEEEFLGPFEQFFADKVI
jgi:hypothetical protein